MHEREKLFAIGGDRLVQAAPRPAPAGGLLLVLPQGPEDLEEALRLIPEAALEKVPVAEFVASVTVSPARTPTSAALVTFSVAVFVRS